MRRARQSDGYGRWDRPPASAVARRCSITLDAWLPALAAVVSATTNARVIASVSWDCAAGRHAGAR